MLKITLVQAEEKIVEIKNSFESFTQKLSTYKDEFLDLKQEDLPVISYNYYKDGADMRHCYCLACGHEYDEENTNNYYSYGYNSKRCPNCKNHKIHQLRYGNTSINTTRKYTFVCDVNEDEGYILLVTFDVPYVYNMNNMDINDCLEKGNYDFLKGQFEKMVPKEQYSYHFSFFTFDKGLRFEDQTVSSYFLSPSARMAEKRLAEFALSKVVGDTSKAQKFLKDNSIVVDDSLTKVLRDRHEAILYKKKQISAKKVKKPNAIVEKYRSYQAKDIDDNKLLGNIKQPFKLLKSQIGSHNTYLFYCPECKEFSEITEPNNRYDSQTICPCCNTEYNDYNMVSRGVSQDRYQTVKYLELMDETNDLLIRVFNIHQTISIDKEYSYQIEEIKRFFFSPSNFYVFKKEDGDFVKGTAHDLTVDTWRSSLYVVQDNSEIKELIEKSSLKYIGLDLAWGLNDNPGICEVLRCGQGSYLYQWYKRPCIEQVLKTNLVTAAREIMCMEKDRFSRAVNEKETTVYSILGINKPVFKIARANNLSLKMIMHCKNFWELDHTLTNETFNEIVQLGSTDTIYEISSRYNIPFAKIIEYVNSCYNYQCIEKPEALRIWRDYLRMAKDMTYRLDNKNTKFPSSLKKEHDKAIFAYRVLEDEKNRKRFIEQAKENEKYEYSYGKFFVKVPKTPEEIIEEGTNQKHCVASYVNRVREGDTVVAFIRYKEHPNDSYFTIEINDDVIVQVKGYTNCAPTDKTLLEFLTKFAVAKKLTLHY